MVVGESVCSSTTNCHMPYIEGGGIYGLIGIGAVHQKRCINGLTYSEPIYSPVVCVTHEHFAMWYM